MHKLLRAGILIILGMLIICTISGCSDDDPPEKIVDPPQLEDDTPPRPTITVIVDPPPNSYLDQNLTEFTLQFSEEVVGVTVNDTTATGFGLTWKVALHMMPLGPGQALNIKWVNQDGSMDTIDVGPYWIFFDDGGKPPFITSATVIDGEVDVDPAPINAGGFRFDFDEDITGAIKLTDGGGVDLNWQAKVSGRTATLTPIAGQELVNGTIYKIEFDIKDGSGNALALRTITFVTEPK